MRTAMALAAAIGLLSFAAAAQEDKYKITPVEKAACATDAIRMCAHTYPDEDRLLECMRGHVRDLSLVCSATFKAGLRRRNIPL